MSNKMFKKMLVSAVILLFIGVAIVPSITGNVLNTHMLKELDISYDNDMVEVIVEIIGVDSEKNFTVLLSLEEFQEVQKILDDISVNFDNEKTTEEVNDIFKEGIISLNEYGLIGDNSVEEVQDLVTGNYIDENTRVRVEKQFERYKNRVGPLGKFNLFSQIEGETTVTGVGRFSSTMCWFLSIISWLLSLTIILYIPFYYLAVFFLLFGGYIFNKQIDTDKSQNSTGGLISFGRKSGVYHNTYSPSEGYVKTQGLIFKRTWEGDNLYGGLLGLQNEYTYYYVGSVGFTGYVIRSSFWEKTNFFGFSLLTRIVEHIPLSK